MDIADTLLSEPMVALLLLVYVSLMSALITSQTFRRSFSRSLGRTIRLFFMRDDDSDESSVRSLRDEIGVLKEDLQKIKLGPIPDETIRKEASEFLDKELPAQLEEKLSHGSPLQMILRERLEKPIENAALKAISGYDLDQILAAKSHLAQEELFSHVVASFEESIKDEHRSAPRIRAIMINLFVVINFAFVALYLAWPNGLPSTLGVSLAVVHFSLVIFIFFMVRIAHYRTGALLSIRENIRNQGLVFRFLDSRSEPLTNVDADVLHMLLTNHMEREHKTRHPYEVVLRNVSGSNVLLRGGRLKVGE